MCRRARASSARRRTPACARERADGPTGWAAPSRGLCIQFASQDLRRSGPNPRKVLALPIKKRDALATQPLEKILCSELLESELGARVCSRTRFRSARAGRQAKNLFWLLVSFTKQEFELFLLAEKKRKIPYLFVARRPTGQRVGRRPAEGSQEASDGKSCGLCCGAASDRPAGAQRDLADLAPGLRENHLSQTTCLTHACFSVLRQQDEQQKWRIMQQIQVAVLDKSCRRKQRRPY